MDHWSFSVSGRFYSLHGTGVTAVTEQCAVCQQSLSAADSSVKLSNCMSQHTAVSQTVTESLVSSLSEQQPADSVQKLNRFKIHAVRDRTNGTFTIYYYFNYKLKPITF